MKPTTERAYVNLSDALPIEGVQVCNDCGRVWVGEDGDSCPDCP